MNKLLLGISGGIAAYKTPDLVRRLQRAGWQVGVAMSPAATKFVSPLALRTVADFLVMDDIFEVESTGVGHIDLADWADLMLVAPATAQMLARLAGGHADEPVSLSFLATRAAKLVFPAMNVNMWQSAAVQRNVERLRADGCEVVDPASGELACGWIGAGRMPDVDDIVRAASAYRLPRDLAGRHVLITAGPTREYLDPVRFLSNPSTGRMGFALAARAADRGARVTLVAGPVELATPPNVQRIDTVSARDMHMAVQETLRRDPADVLIATAAVADWTPAETALQKQKKMDGPLQLALVRTPDILLEAVAEFAPKIAVGFAAETDDVRAYAREKLDRKKLDIIVANKVGGASGGFADTHNHVWILDRDGGEVEVPLQVKDDVATHILDAVVRRLAALPA
jgi:phosphopantothenoylcysteine decarboxylase/phosphopantothenate--cysteine ligase